MERANIGQIKEMLARERANIGPVKVVDLHVPCFMEPQHRFLAGYGELAMSSNGAVGTIWNMILAYGERDDIVYQFGDARLTMRNLKEAAAYALISVTGEATASISGLSASGKKIIAGWLNDEFRVTGSENRARLLTMLADVTYYPCHEFSNANPMRMVD